MRSVLVLLIAVVACSHPAGGPKAPGHAAAPAPWRGPEILAAVPADTPYLLGLIEPMGPGVRERIVAQTGEQLKQGLQKAASGEGPMALVAASLYSELDGVDAAHWPEAVGLAPDARLVLYGLSVWPVMRIEIADEARVRQLLARIVKAGAPDLQPRSVGRAMLYVVGEKRLSYVFGVVGRELVAAVVPAPFLERALPKIIGSELPAHSMRDAPVLPSLMAKHHFRATTIGMIDLHRVFEAISGHGKGQADDLAASFAGLIPGTCQDDLARIADTFPRLAFGYRHLDEKGFDAAFVIEAQASLAADLTKLAAPMPAIPASPPPMFAMGAAVDVDGLMGWLKTAAGTLRAHPFRCDALSGANHAVDEVASKLDQPIPNELHGLHGFELVVDDATVLPPSGTGYLLVDGAHVADEIRKLTAKVPQLATLQIGATGAPLELPLARMGFPPSFTSGHFAMRPARAVIAVGPDSATRAGAMVSAPATRVPLVTMVFDVARVKDRFGMFLKDVDFKSIANIGAAALGLEVAPDGIAFTVTGTWLPAAH